MRDDPRAISDSWLIGDEVGRADGAGAEDDVDKDWLHLSIERGLRDVCQPHSRANVAPR
jgi:hypothetical protein